MRKIFSHSILLFSLVLIAGSVIFAAGLLRDILRKEISRTSEKELSVHLSAAFGRLFIGKGERGKIFDGEFREPEDRKPPEISYRINSNRGELKIETKEHSKFWKGYGSHDWDWRKWTLKFSSAVPISFKIELGAGEGEFDLTGLQIKELKIESGASSAELTCDEPNPIEAERVEIESGVSKFEAFRLCNLNFRKLKFSGGVGAYRLDFGGTLKQDANAKIEVGLGAITIVLPKETPTRIFYDDSWLSSIDLPSSFSKTKKGIYETENYEGASKRLTIDIESGLGSVKVRTK